MPECLNKLVACALRLLFEHSLPMLLGIALYGSLILVSCGGGSNSPAPLPTLQSISVSPQSETLAAGLKQQYSATGNYSDGTSKAVSGVTWTTSDSTLATVNSTGLVTGVKQGAVTVSAASGTMTGSASLTVSPPNLVSVSVSPQNPTISVVQAQQFMAAGSYTDGSTQNLTGVTWSSGTPTVASVSNTGLATSLTAGSTTIRATSGSIGGSTTLTVTPLASGAITYLMGQTLPSGGTHPEAVGVGDFNGDGKPDIVVSNMDTNTVAVFLNDGTGNFGTPIVTTVTITALGLGALAVGDFNEDGKADVVVGTIGGSQANIVLLGNGDGTFSQQPPINNSFGFFHAKVVDLNGDGHQDLVLAGNGGIFVSIGRGDGTFVDTIGLQSGSFPGTYLGIGVADFNGDGKLDIVGSDTGSATGGVGYLDFFAGNGDGTFTAPTFVDLPASLPGSLANADFNGDGKQDVVIAYPNTAILSFGNGDGTFDLNLLDSQFVYSSSATTDNAGVTVFAADLDKDGKFDVVASDLTTGTLQITLNSALGEAPPFAGIYSFNLAPGLTDIAAADLNGDGVLDVVVINFQTNQITTVLSKLQ